MRWPFKILGGLLLIAFGFAVFGPSPKQAAMAKVADTKKQIADQIKIKKINWEKEGVANEVMMVTATFENKSNRDNLPNYNLFNGLPRPKVASLP